MRGTGRDRPAKTHQQLAPISHADIERGTATAAHFPYRRKKRKKTPQISRRLLFSVAGEFLRAGFQDGTVTIHPLPCSREGG